MEPVAVTTPAGPAPAVPPVTEALRAQAAQQRGGYVYAIDPYFDPNGAVPPYGIIGGWSVDSFGQLDSFTHNPNYRPSPTALEFPPPVTALDEALQRAVTGYGSEQELLAAFREATLLLFAQEGQTGLYSVVEDDGSRYIPAFTHPTHAPDTWHQWQQTTGQHLAATGLPVRLNPGHRISLTIPGEAVKQAGGENAGPTPDDHRDPAPSPPQFMVDITPSGRPAVYARLIGTYEITGLDAPDAEHSPLLHEALVMLLLHREGVHPRVLASVLWPRGVTEDVRDALIERLRTWLGSDPDGTPRLGTDTTGQLTLAPSVVSDLDVLRTLHYEATAGRGARKAHIRERLLNDALALAHGPLLANRPQGRYTWLSHENSEAELPLLVADVALALSAHHLEAGNPAPALNALNTALTTAPTDERLWNELLRAAHATGDAAKLESTAASLVARNHEHSGDARSLPPRTEALLDELLPSWRDAQSAAD
ncbi:type VII secretion system-associated protein [Streptomyces tubercidicus]|uniref:type VII secretion system-associated protein n=1 Tax=Streptomyces tubercidicus TaxID=47759 RepID=UPI003530AA34